MGSEEDEDKGYRDPVLSPTSQTVTDPAGSTRFRHMACAAYTQAQVLFQLVGRCVYTRVGACILLVGSITGGYSRVDEPPFLES